MPELYKKVKTAVVGCGSISSIYIRNLKSLFTIIDLVALCNRTRSKAEENPTSREKQKRAVSIAAVIAGC